MPYAVTVTMLEGGVCVFFGGGGEPIIFLFKSGLATRELTADILVPAFVQTE